MSSAEIPFEPSLQDSGQGIWYYFAVMGQSVWDTSHHKSLQKPEKRPIVVLRCKTKRRFNTFYIKLLIILVSFDMFIWCFHLDHCRLCKSMLHILFNTSFWCVSQRKQSKMFSYLLTCNASCCLWSCIFQFFSYGNRRGWLTYEIQREMTWCHFMNLVILLNCNG